MAGQTRLQCSYCTGVIELGGRPRREDWVVPQLPSASEARASALRWLREVGVYRSRLHVGRPRRLPWWQVVSEAGEEWLGCAAPEPSPLLRALRLPISPMVPRASFHPRGADPLPEPALGERAALDAARASFRDAGSPLRTARLLWLALVPLELHVQGGEVVEGVYLPGADKVVFAPLPAHARRPPARPRLLRLYAAYCAAAWLLGVLAPGPGWVLVLEALLLAVALPLVSRAAQRPGPPPVGAA